MHSHRCRVAATLALWGWIVAVQAHDLPGPQQGSPRDQQVAGSGTSAYLPGVDMNYSDGVSLVGDGGPMRLASDVHIPMRSEVVGETAALNRADVLPRGELSLAPHAGAAEGGFLRPF